MTNSKIKWNIDGIRSVDNDEKKLLEEPLILHNEQNATYIYTACLYLGFRFQGGKSIS